MKTTLTCPEVVKNSHPAPIVGRSTIRDIILPISDPVCFLTEDPLQKTQIVWGMVLTELKLLWY